MFFRKYINRLVAQAVSREILEISGWLRGELLRSDKSYVIQRDNLKEELGQDFQAATQKLESYYEMAREARSIAIDALAQARSLDETKAYLWKASNTPTPQPETTGPSVAPHPDLDDELEGNSNVVSMYGTF